jgi:transposase-like protein
MRYSYEFKENIVQKALTRKNVREVAEETGVTAWSIYQWIKQFESGNIKADETGPKGYSLNKKQLLLLEAQSIPEEDQGEWLRKNGLHSDHLNKWRDEIFDMMNKKNEDKIEIRKLKQKNKELEKEINRKDKALAEVTALLTLKKKLNHLWEDEEK